MGYQKRFALHEFSSLNGGRFVARDYSRFKFGSDRVARAFGEELALGFFGSHAASILSNKCVVIPSPYNYVKNAATLVARHFVDALNSLLVDAGGDHVEYSTIHRKVSYTNDYGFLTKEARQGLIKNDCFYMNTRFYDRKLLLFIDDVRITGTHEEKLSEVINAEGMNNDVFYLYYASYSGARANIEAELNFAAIQSLDDYLDIICAPDQKVIVRTIKYALSLSYSEFQALLSRTPEGFVRALYYGALGEGYYQIPAYQQNFFLLKQHFAAKDAGKIAA